MMDEINPFFASRLQDIRFVSVARQLYGNDGLGEFTDANRYTGATNWHCDTAPKHQFGVKCAF